MALKRARPSDSSQPLKPAKRSRTVNLDSTQSPRRPFKTFVFGEGTAGELGLGNVRSATQHKIPYPNKLLGNVGSIVAGGMHCLAVSLDGHVLSWGGNDHFALGRPTPEDDDDDDDEDPQAPGLNPKEATPTALGSFSSSPVVQVAAGDSCSFALTSEGSVYGWGTFRDHNGPRGFTYDIKSKTIPDEFQKLPALLPGLPRIVQISAGADFALALDAGGRVYGWGVNSQCEAGLRLNPRHHEDDEVLLPHRASLPRANIVSIHTGSYHAFAIDRSGATWAWGLNNFGQTGIAEGAGEDSPIVYPPQRVRSLAGYKMKSIAGGTHHSVGLTVDGVCLVWGRIDGFQTGLDMQAIKALPTTSIISDEAGRPRILLEPTAVPIPSCTAVASGTDHSIAITGSGKAFIWGLNASGQCGQGNEVDVPKAQEMTARTVAEEHLIGATAGGQFSMIMARDE